MTRPPVESLGLFALAAWLTWRAWRGLAFTSDVAYAALLVAAALFARVAWRWWRA